jgi:lysophospholipase L1-like esterase
MRRLLAVAVSLALALLVVPTAPAAATSAPVPGLPVYLALGDSVGLGQAAAPIEGDYLSTVAQWRKRGYAGQLVTPLRLQLDCLPAWTRSGGCLHLQYVSLARTAVPEGLPGMPARPGVTTTAFIEEQLPVAVELLRSRNGDANPRNDVELVSLTVGGNDVFGPIIAACVTGGTPTSPGCLLTVVTAVQGVAARYDRILGELRAAAGPGTVLLTTTYDNPLPSCFLGAPPFSAGPLAAQVLEQVPVSVGGVPALGLNGVIRSVSARHGAVVADAYGQLRSPDDFAGGLDCLHPDESGHQRIADIAVAALRSAGVL